MDSNYRFRAKTGTLWSPRPFSISLKLFAFCRRSRSVGGVSTANSVDIEPVSLHVASTKELNSRPILS